MGELAQADRGFGRFRALWAGLIVMGTASAAFPGEPGAGDRFGRAGTVKVRIDRATSSSARPALPSTARVVDDFGAFTIVEEPADAPPAGGEVLPLENLIQLNAGPIDTTLPAVRQMQAPRGNFAGRALHLVQFAGPIKPEWFDDLSQTGVQIVTYIPSNAYLVYGDAGQLAAVQALAAARPTVQWEGAYRDEYRIDPGALPANRPAGLSPDAQDYYTIQLVADPVANAATRALIDRLKSGAVVNQFAALGYENIIVRLPADAVARVAHQPEVVSIQAYYPPRLFCERQDQIIAGNLTGTAPSGPGYLAWLGTKGFTQAQFTASAFVVDLSDSPVDQGNLSPNHFGLWEGGVLNSVSHVSYARTVSGSSVTGPPTQHGCDGHGNLNAHIIGGYNNNAASPHVDASGFHYGLGVCPFVKVGSSVIFNTSGAFTNPSFGTLQSTAYANGARISSNSWGSTTSNAYDSMAQTYDGLVRDAQSGTAGNQEMCIVFAMGNSGSGAGTVRTPATAKNVISVGAAENVQAFGGTDGSGISDSGANSANDIISFSSRGPCPDGRKKPDIVGPGTHVSGGVAQASPSAAGNGAADACFTGSGVSGGVAPNKFFPAGQQFFSASSGTSHSTPALSGACALVRQMFINQGMSVPSPAMTKALLMNAARYLNGTGANDTLWSNSQGMGEANLGETFNRGVAAPTLFRDEVAGDMFTATGQTRTFTGIVADNTKPFRVTLAWTDAPGPTSGNAFKNNLNLTVVVGANTYRGNVFTGANSTTGGSADAANNVESVFLPAGTTGNITITVTAGSINSDGVPGVGGALDQDFALVAYNASIGCPTITLAPASLPNGTEAAFYNQTITASGGTGPYNFIVTSGALPPGLSLATSGALTGTPTATGTSNFTVQATDSATCTGSKAYSITVVCPTITVAPASLPSGTVGAAYSQSLSPSTGTAPFNWSVSAGALPGGLTLSPAGLLSGTPTAPGSFNFTAQVTDNAGCTGSRAYALSVVCPTINVSPVSLPNGTVGTAYSQTLTASGGVGSYAWGVTAGALPGGLSLSPTGDITGSPSGQGTFNFTAQATDTAGCTGSRAYALTINCPTISILPASLPNGTIGAAYSQTLTAGGGTGPYSWLVSAGALPGGLTLAPTGDITGSPTHPGTFNFTAQATDSTGCAGSAALSITVDCPTISILPRSLPNGTTGVAYSASFSASGGTPAYSWSISSGALPAGLSLSPSGDISGSPTASGTANFVVQVTDSVGCGATAGYSISVNCATIDIGPAALPDGTTGAAYSQTLSATGGTGLLDWSILSGALPAGLSLSPSGDITGTPTAAGTANFSAQVVDGAGCAGSLAYTLTVNCTTISVSPAALPDGMVGAAYSQTLGATGGTPAYAFNLTTGALPDGLTLSPAGDLSGTPTTAGSATFGVRAVDLYGCEGTREYTVNIASVPACPLPGDLNGDTLINGGDVQPFVDCLIAGSTLLGDCSCGDYDHSGIVDAPDVAPFVAGLLSP
ncbi:MAG: putative Ig domain-containing protein [Phycisphaerae bacterium]